MSSPSHTSLLKNLTLYRNGPTWCGRKITETPTLTRYYGGKEGGTFDLPRRAQAASHARKSSQGSLYTGVSTASSLTSSAKRAVFVVIALNPFIMLR